jgi:putative membrane protein (TIGR04086 family)
MKSDGARSDRPPPIQPVGFFTGVQVRPVVLGVIVDYIATYAAIQAYLFLFVMRQMPADGEAPPDAIPLSVSANETLLIAFIIGSLGTVLGGFVAGRKAGAFEAKHGAFVGLGSLIVSFIELLMQDGPPSGPEWFRMISVLAIIPAGALGGYLAERLKVMTARQSGQGGRFP